MDNKISACLVVYNEEKVIERCLKSIEDLVDEIIIVHDGECNDKTIDIAKKYTDKIFIKEHIGIAEPHRSFTYNEVQIEWIVQIDADEFFEEESLQKIKELIKETKYNGFNFKWELWDGKKNYRIKGIKKLVLFKKDRIKYQGIPQTAVSVLGKMRDVGIMLRHKPLFDNVSWKAVNKKRKYWLLSHVKYFFPESIEYKCFNDTPDSWIEYTKKVRKYPFYYVLFYPLKNFLGQIKNGLIFSYVGINASLQQYVYYLSLYWGIYKLNKKLKYDKKN